MYIICQLAHSANIAHALAVQLGTPIDPFTETCEGMLSLNNDEIRPEVAYATPLGGKDYTCCIASKRRQTIDIRDTCL